MCHADDSRPPAPPRVTPAASDQPLTLTAADGTTLLAHEALPSEANGVGFVVLPDVRGLHQYYRDLTVRFAETGAAAVAIDYFGRTADTDDRTDAFAFRPHVEQTTPEGITADVAAAVTRLQQAGATRIFTVGFCFGGSMSWKQSALTPGLAGCIGFYGRSALILEDAPLMTAPLLMLIAGADANIPLEDSEQLAAAAPNARRVVFDGMPHSFFDRSFAEHAEACAQAWREILDFTALRR